MMEEEPEIDLHETFAATTSVSDDLHIPESLESIDLLCDSSTTSVVGEMTGKLEEEDLLDDPILLTSSSKTTPQHNTFQNSQELDVPKVEKVADALSALGMGLQTDVDNAAQSLDNVNLSESHSSFSDLGQSLAADTSSYDGVSPSFDGVKSIHSEGAKADTGILEPVRDSDTTNEKEISNENKTLTETDTNHPVSSDVSKYFEGLTMDDPFDFTTTTQNEVNRGDNLCSQGPLEQLLPDTGNWQDKNELLNPDALTGTILVPTREGAIATPEFQQSGPLVSTEPNIAAVSACSSSAAVPTPPTDASMPTCPDSTGVATYPASAAVPAPADPAKATYPDNTATPACPDNAQVPTFPDTAPASTFPTNAVAAVGHDKTSEKPNAVVKPSTNSIQDFFRQSSEPDSYSIHGSAITPDTFSPTRVPQEHIDYNSSAPFVNSIQQATHVVPDNQQIRVQDTRVGSSTQEPKANMPYAYASGTQETGQTSSVVSENAQGKHSSALSSQLKQNLKQAAGQVHNIANGGSYPSPSNLPCNTPPSPHHPVYCTPGTHYTDQYEDNPMFTPQPRESNKYGGALHQSSPLFVPSVYNYSTKPTNQPQIFTPAPQDFSSHMTYSSSPSKYYDETEGQYDHSAMDQANSGLWSWVKHHVNAEWAEGAHKIGKQLMEKTKHATDTVLTTLDPGMEEYLSKTDPVTNIAVASNNEAIVQGVRQGFRNIFGHVVVKGENIRHNQAPLPVGFSSGVAAVCDKLNVLANTNLRFQGSHVTVATEVFLTELEQQRWNAMFCLGIRDSQNGIDIRTFSQPIPLPIDCVSLAYSKSSAQQLQSGYGISIDEVVSLAKPSIDKDWCHVLSGINLYSVITMASQCLAADYKRQLELRAHSNPQAVLQW